MSRRFPPTNMSPEELKEKERREVIEATRRGIEDVKAGRVTPAEQVFREFEEKYGIPHDDDL